jgi:chaperonin GroEL (HSP60 family)
MAMGNDVMNSSTTDKNTSPNGMEQMAKMAKTLEQRYIELLEEKIARLEREIKLNKDEEKAVSETSVSIILLSSLPHFYSWC